MNTRQEKQRSVDAICAALKEYRQESYIEPPVERIGHGDYCELSRHQIDQGVIALVHACNLTAGSVGDVDLYKLIRFYLQDDEARDQMNLIIMQTKK
ncbi:hypothetical protein ACO0LG_17040 [Undibacterium sp. Ji42W]|uniref:hypothetical protein n=1 Tax=Undibacterium sp. Ji42W TaxID=3413039 RepID=UPI003BF3779F